MRGDIKRKWRWSSKSLVASNHPNKVLIVDQSMLDTQDSAAARFAVNEMSFDGCSMEDDHERLGMAARMRRHGSKFLSIVGLQRNSDIHNAKRSSHPPSERDVALAIVKDAASSSTSTASRSQALSPLGQLESSPSKKIPITLLQDHSQARLSPLAEIEVAQASVADQSRTSSKPAQSYLVPVDTHIQGKELGLRQSKSNAGFAHQLSHKLSATFGNPTIVHRPNLRTRPSLLSLHEDTPQDPGAQSDQESSPHASTAPSSYNYSGSVSARDPSTGKTSLESNFASLRYAKAPDGNDNPSDTANVATAEIVVREKPLTPIQEAPLVITPTVVTVETTANAKIFFETHFSSLLAGHASPRSIRRNHLELRLESQSMSEEQRQQERSAWAAYENEHLRQTRVLKSKTKEKSKGSGSGVAVAGYEVVRILGKGSFGVVRLVREKNDTVLAPYTPPAVSNWKQSPREELNNLRATAIEALKSTLDGPKSTHHGRGSKTPQKEVYAMKVIRKSEMLRNCQEGHLRAERDFLVASEKSRWVVPLISSFQDSTSLYLVMEYMVGGDFLGLLFRKDTLKERHARWYIAEMILCVEEAHRLRWIHRDVKPDNFLITASGHLKISDFGLAFDGHWAHDQRYFKNHRQSLMEKLGIEVKGDSQDQEEDALKEVKTNLADILTGRRGRHEKPQADGPSEHESILQWRNRHGKRRLAGSVVGTSQYMGPEVIRGDPYDGRCDWWSIGIILYECLYGFTPFVCEKREDTKAKILDNAKTLIFPDEREVDRKEKVSFEAMELINSLLQEKEHRLCSKKYRLNDYQHSKRTPGQLIARRADPHAQDYQGNYVYPDDATDIKAHIFFRRISWDRLHLTRPPFVPDVSGRDDTKYFDEEEPISDVDDAASQSDLHDASDKDARNVALSTARMTQVDGAQGQDDLLSNPAASGRGGKGGPGGREGEAGKMKDKKRPRDRVLRDKDVSRKVLEIRKKGAFLGYTYHRPKRVSFEEERGRQRGARSMIPSFD